MLTLPEHYHSIILGSGLVQVFFLDKIRPIGRYFANQCSSDRRGHPGFCCDQGRPHPHLRETTPL